MAVENRTFSLASPGYRCRSGWPIWNVWNSGKALGLVIPKAESLAELTVKISWF